MNSKRQPNQSLDDSSAARDFESGSFERDFIREDAEAKNLNERASKYKYKIIPRLSKSNSQNSQVNTKVSGAVTDHLKKIWERASRVAVPVAALGGFVSDVLSPLGPVVSTLTIVAALICVTSGLIWFGFKRKQIRLAMADGVITDQEYKEIAKFDIWSVTFSFSFVASVILFLFFAAQKVTASDEPGKGAVANAFPFVAKLQESLLGLRKTAERIELSTKNIESGNVALNQKIDNLAVKLEGLNLKLSHVSSSTDVVQAPQNFEDHFVNARIYEMRKDYTKARQSYIEYFKSPQQFLDPHLSFSALLKIQDGVHSARESYSLLVGINPSPSGLLTRALMGEKQDRITAIEQLVKDHSEFGPAYYYLSLEYANPESGQQTLDNMRKEKVALNKFRELTNRGMFNKFYLDQKLAQSLEKEADQRLKKFVNLSDAFLNAAPKLTILPSNKGWEGVIVLPFDGAQVYVKFPGSTEFKSTGFTSNLSPATGKPIPKTVISLSDVKSKGVIAIKYTDTQGNQHGPYEQEFDPLQEFVALAKRVLPKEGHELAPIHRWKDKKTITLVQFLTFRGAISKLKVGPDPDHLNQSLKLPNGPAPLSIVDVKDDEPLISQDIPTNWKKVFLRVDYADGTSSEPILLE